MYYFVFTYSSNEHLSNFVTLLQLLAKQEDKGHSSARVASPVNVVQRTWESRSRAIQKEAVTQSEKLPAPKAPRSRSSSPVHVSPPSSQAKQKANPQTKGELKLGEESIRGKELPLQY